MLKKVIFGLSFIMFLQGIFATESNQISKKDVDDYFKLTHMMVINTSTFNDFPPLQHYVDYDAFVQKGIERFGIEKCVHCQYFHTFKPSSGNELVSDGRLDQQLKNRISYRLQQLYKQQDVPIEEFLESHKLAVTAATIPMRGFNDKSQDFHLQFLINLLNYQKQGQ